MCMSLVQLVVVFIIFFVGRCRLVTECSLPLLSPVEAIIVRAARVLPTIVPTTNFII